MINSYGEIAKDISLLRKRPNLEDWEDQYANWSWNKVREELHRDGGFVNLAYECIDRHADGDNAEKTAMLWQSAGGDLEIHSYADMKAQSNRFANALRSLDITKGERIFFLCDRIPELYFAIFGTFKIGAIVAPLFSAFGPQPVKERFNRASGSVIITTPQLLPKVDAIRHELPSLKYVIVIAHREGAEVEKENLGYAQLVNGASTDFEMERTGEEDWSIIHFTSGTTGLPKGATHVHGAVVGHYATGKYVLDLQEDDIYWCTADPGWVTGTSYGMFAPWSNGVTQVIDEGGFSARRWYENIEKFKINIWYTAPTAIRLLMKAGVQTAKKYDLSSLRHAMSVGEPLNPEAVVWGIEAFDLPFHDNWWQSETGAIMIANYSSMPIRPGSMGRPFPGIQAAIIDSGGNELVQPMAEGQLAIRPPWPSMFRTYWNDPERYDSCFRQGWYLTGDKAKRDADGYFWFVGRNDDVINTAGHLVSPFEVESALIEHEAIAEAGVIGKPDAIAMEVVKAFVTLHEGIEDTPELLRSLKQHCRQRLGPGVAPREIDIVDILPKTRSGKIMRRLLKARELGLPEGDTSTLEDD
ncbi:MAG: acetate--CoA ligase [Saprospiraceae bacterium]|nr:acetate--CoA ligase [Saprospiraceae bacterium]